MFKVSFFMAVISLSFCDASQDDIHAGGPLSSSSSREDVTKDKEKAGTSPTLEALVDDIVGEEFNGSFRRIPSSENDEKTGVDGKKSLESTLPVALPLAGEDLAVGQQKIAAAVTDGLLALVDGEKNDEERDEGATTPSSTGTIVVKDGDASSQGSSPEENVAPLITDDLFQKGGSPEEDEYENDRNTRFIREVFSFITPKNVLILGGVMIAYWLSFVFYGAGYIDGVEQQPVQ